jgi:hypothetical protein
MSLRLIVRPEAEADILEAALWYESREAGLGLELTSEIHAAIERALESRSHIYFCANIRMCVESSRDDFHIVSLHCSAERYHCFRSRACCARRTALA